MKKKFMSQLYAFGFCLLGSNYINYFFLLNAIGYFILFYALFAYHEERLSFAKWFFTEIIIIYEKLDQMLYIIK